MNTTTEVERTPLKLAIDGQTIAVEQLGVRLPFARKPAHLREVSETSDRSNLVYVIETREMTPAEFDALSSSLLRSREWLKGKGGYVGAGRLCVEVRALGRPSLYIDPSGGDYPRYVARLG